MTRELCLCVIARDAWRTIDALLDPIWVLFDKIIIVDTGSVDGTVEKINSKYKSVTGVEADKFIFVQVPWEKNFSKARNETLKYLNPTDVWVWLDADDTVKPEYVQVWRDTMAALTDDAKGYFNMPYEYAHDKQGNCIALLNRERLMIGNQWEWVEPVHEVCCATIGNAPCLGCLNTPVAHKPLRNRDVDPDRNWAILTHAYVTDAHVSIRTLYYLQQEALSRGQEQFVITLGAMIARDIDGPTHHMYPQSQLLTIQAYLTLGHVHDDKGFLAIGISLLDQHIARYTERNEARNIKIEQLLFDAKNAPLCLDLVTGMKTEAPLGFVVSPFLYSQSYIAALRAKINLVILQTLEPGRGIDTMLSTIATDWLEATEKQPVDPLCLEVEDKLRELINKRDYVVVTYNDELVGMMTEFIARIKEQGGRVLISTNQRMRTFAKKVTYHIGEVQLIEDVALQTRRMQIQPPADYRHKRVPGWDLLEWPCLPLESPMTGDMGVPRVYTAPTLFDALNLVKSSHDKRIVVRMRDAGDSSEDLVTHVLSMPNSTFAIGSFGAEWYIGGDVAEINKTWVDSVDSNVLHMRRGIEKKMVPAGTFDAHVSVVNLGAKPNKFIAILAGGLELWDGTTPYKWGIGGSEGCVVALAEEFVKRGHYVKVWCTTKEPITVAGVDYAPLGEQPRKFDEFDLLISSRLPNELYTRRCNQQVLWCHDNLYAYMVPGFDIRKAVVDRVVCLSDWQTTETGEIIDMLEDEAVIVIPNGVHENRQPIVRHAEDANIMIWNSQPERGLKELLDCYASYANIGIPLLKVVYGWGNILSCAKDPDTRLWALNLKARLRSINANIYGRLGRNDLFTVLRESTCCCYSTSNFPETFCISILEAIDALGAQNVDYGDNGAVAETVAKFSEYNLITQDDALRLEVRWPCVAELWSMTFFGGIS